MKPFLTSITATAFLLSAFPAFAIGASSSQDSPRGIVRQYPNLLSPQIHDALIQILAAEEQFTLLISPFDEHGVSISQAEHERRLTDPASPLKQYLDRHRARFDTQGLNMDIEGLRDCIYYDAAFGVAAELLAKNTDLNPNELLAALDLRFIEGTPIWPTDLAQEFNDRFQANHELPPLGNGRALARLTWGVLQQDAWWNAGDRDRGELILGLLERGLQSRLLAQVVDFSLANAMRPSSDPTMDGHGVCAPHLPLAEDVGYDRRHEDALESDLELVTYLSSLQDPTGHFDLDRVEVELLPNGAVDITPNQLGHLRYWVPRRLEHVRDELYEGKHREQLHLALRRSTSLEQRYLYWGELAASSDFASFRVEMLEELRAMLALESDFPGTERLRELEFQAEVRDLTDAERRELGTLQVRADQEQDKFITTLTRYLVNSGAEANIDLLVTTLRDDLAKVLDPLAAPGDQRLNTLLNDAWYRLATSSSKELNRILEQTLVDPADGGTDLPASARDNLIWAATRDAGASARLNLDRVLDAGSPRDVAVALLNPEWASEATYSRAMGELIQDAWSNEVGTMTRLRIEAYFSSSMTNRPVTHASKEILLASLRDERWASKTEACYWSQAWEDPTRFAERIDLVRRYMTPQEIELMTAQGLLPKGIF